MTGLLQKKHNTLPRSKYGYIEPSAAKNAIQRLGTPVRLLKLFYESLNVQLVLFQGDTCRYVYTPPNWDTLSWKEKDTVVLNIWSNHVFTYDKIVNKIPFNAKKFVHLDKKLVSLDEAEEKYDFSKMQPFTWGDLMVAIQERARGTFFWTTQMLDETFFNSLEDHKISFYPRWRTPEQCRSIYIPLGDKTKSGVRIVKLPDNYNTLVKFADMLQSRGVNLKYMGESSGVFTVIYSN